MFSLKKLRLQNIFLLRRKKVSGWGALSEIEQKWGGGAYAKGGAYAGEYGTYRVMSYWVAVVVLCYVLLD